MINLSLDELRLMAENRNIRDYENKSEKVLIKTPKPKIRINKKKLEEIRMDFNKLRHKFSKKEIVEKLFMILKIIESFWIRNKEGKQKSYQTKKKFEVEKVSWWYWCC